MDMKVKELLIEFQEYQLEYEVLNANCSHNAAANLFMERYRIKNCFIPDVIDTVCEFGLKSQKTSCVTNCKIWHKCKIPD